MQNTPLDFLVDTVEELKGRLEISLTRFANVKLRTRGDRWIRKLGRVTVVQALYGMQKLAAGLMADRYVRPGHQPRIPDRIADQLQDRLLPGDVILVRKEYALTNYFLPGYWPHVALYVGSNHDLSLLNVVSHRQSNWDRLCDDMLSPRVLESMKDGVFFRPLSSPLASDSLVVIRPRLDPTSISIAIERAICHEGKPYDFDFDFRRSDRLVCSEVVYRAYDGVGPMRFELVNRAGRPTLSGHDLVELSLKRQLFEPVAAFVPAIKQEVEFDSASLTELIQRTTKI